MMKNFCELESLLNAGSRQKLVLANAADEHALQSVQDLAFEGYVDPILVGRKMDIECSLSRLGISEGQYPIIDVQTDLEAAHEAVRLVRTGQSEIILKGDIQTRDLLKAVVNTDTGIKDADVLSHVALFQIPIYSKILALTDGGMVVEPDLGAKLSIVENALSVMKCLGYNSPKVAVLAAAEQVNPKSRASVDARALQEISLSGRWPGCVVDGPISLDLALFPSIADAKKYKGQIHGDADVLVVPDIVAGNVLGKCFSLIAGGEMAGVIVGAQAPVVVTSRASSTQEKRHSIILALALAQART